MFLLVSPLCWLAVLQPEDRGRRVGGHLLAHIDNFDALALNPVPPIEGHLLELEGLLFGPFKAGRAMVKAANDPLVRRFLACL